MSVLLYSNYIEIFKFVESGWFALFEEVLEFRRQEARAGRGYHVAYVGEDERGYLVIRLIPWADEG